MLVSSPPSGRRRAGLVIPEQASHRLPLPLESADELDRPDPSGPRSVRSPRARAGVGPTTARPDTSPDPKKPDEHVATAVDIAHDEDRRAVSMAPAPTRGRRRPAGAPPPGGGARRRARASALLDQALEKRELGLEPVRVDGGPRDQLDLGVLARRHHLAVPDELLVELLARRRADELDRDLASRLLAREPDHLLGEVDDPDGLAHVEDVDLAAIADRARLHDERGSLGNGHEEARHLGMRHVTGPPRAIWRRKIGTTEPISRSAPRRSGCQLHAMAPRLHDPLGERLRLPHHRLRIRRLVGRDEHESLCPCIATSATTRVPACCCGPPRSGPASISATRL
jgi:hypothetical protein